MNESPVAKRLWGSLLDKFGDYQFQLLDDSSGEIIAAANCLPLSWDEDPETLPDGGWEWAFSRGVDDAMAGRSFKTLCALQIVIKPELRGQGLSVIMLSHMKSLGRANGLKQLLAPVRPTLKPMYPLIPIERYITWRRGDNSHFDPWIRIHEKDGARIIRPCHRAMEVPGTIAQWESWTNLEFPESGKYVVAGALNPITIDVERDLGLYIEPNVWMRHPL